MFHHLHVQAKNLAASIGRVALGITENWHVKLGPFESLDTLGFPKISWGSLQVLKVTCGSLGLMGFASSMGQ